MELLQAKACFVELDRADALLWERAKGTMRTWVHFSALAPYHSVAKPKQRCSLGAALLLTGLMVIPGCAPTPENGNTLKAEAVATAYVARFRDDNHETPDTSDVGAFFLRSGCLVFVSDSGTSYLPVFPRATQLVPSGDGGWQLQLGAKAVVEGRHYRVKGGEGQYSWLDPAVPPGCPARQFLVGEVR